MVGLTQIVFAATFDVYLFNHPVNAMTLLGTALIIAPTAWLLTRPRAHSNPGTASRTRDRLPRRQHHHADTAAVTGG